MRMSVVSANEKGTVRKFLCTLLITIVALTLIFVWVNMRIRPFVTSVTGGYAKNTVSMTLNEMIQKEMSEGNYNFIDMQHDADGRVTAAMLNSIDTNILRAKIITDLKHNISSLDEQVIKIPIGNFLPYQFCAGMGPRIPIRFLILSNTSVDVKESFTAQGINQTLYVVSFDIVTRVGIYIPTMMSSVEVKNNIPIAQTLIVGNVPDSYTSVNGASGEAADIVLDAVN